MSKTYLFHLMLNSALVSVKCVCLVSHSAAEHTQMNPAAQIELQQCFSTKIYSPFVCTSVSDRERERDGMVLE